jgi:DNA-binding NarL/FixJ family response regulator
MNTCTLNQAENSPGIRTLVVDDSPFMLKVLVQILEEVGNFDLVATATNGRQALSYMSLLSPDLVLIDVHMPGLNGIQATRDIKQREHAPVVVIVTSDDSPVTKATAEKAGADGFVIKEANLRHRLIGALQDLFGPNGARCAKIRNTLNGTRRPPNKTSEKSLGNFTSHEWFDSALGKCAIQETDPGQAPAPCETPSVGSAQRPQPRYSHSIRHTVGRSLCQTVADTHQQLAQLCASSRIQAARKASANTCDAMKTGKRQGNTGYEKAKNDSRRSSNNRGNSPARS